MTTERAQAFVDVQISQNELEFPPINVCLCSTEHWQQHTAEQAERQHGHRQAGEALPDGSQWQLL